MSSQDEIIEWMVGESSRPHPDDAGQWIVHGDWRRTSRAKRIWRDTIESEAADEPFPTGGVLVIELDPKHRARTWQIDKPCPPSLEIVLPTTKVRFAKWLKGHTRDWGERVFRCADRTVCFGPFHWGKWLDDDKQGWHEDDLGTVRWFAGKDHVEVVNGVEYRSSTSTAIVPLIKLGCLETGSELMQQISVGIECFDSWVWRFFWTHYLELLTDIGQTWPQSRPAIDKHLSGLGIAAMQWCWPCEDGPLQGGKRNTNPGLERSERVKRLALAQEATELRAEHADKKADWPWHRIARAIGWPHGCQPNSSGLKLLGYARADLSRLKDHDPDGLLDEVEALRQERQKERKT